MRLSQNQKHLRKAVLEISHSKNLSHIGSCLSAIDLIDIVYRVKKSQDEFILSNGHAAIAWYAVLEKYGFINRSQVLKLHLHPDRNTSFGIPVSTGSLGHGLPISVGFALARPQDRIYCMISDGELSEGSIWESFRLIKKLKIQNITVILNSNGWTAYDPVNQKEIEQEMKAIFPDLHLIDGHNIRQIKQTWKAASSKKQQCICLARTNSDQLSFLNGLDSHYKVMTPAEYQLALKELQ